MAHLNNQKLGPLKKWATQIATDMISRIFQEFEREAGVAFDEVSQMRAELVRVSELLEGQMQREKELHALLESLHGHMAGAGSHALGGLQQPKGPDLSHLHALLDQAVQAAGQQDQSQSGIMARLEHALAQADGHSNHAKNLKQQSITTEHELARIKKLLAMPPPNQLPSAAPTTLNFSSSTLPQAPATYSGSPTYAGSATYAQQPATYQGAATYSASTQPGYPTEPVAARPVYTSSPQTVYAGSTQYAQGQ